jgi:hypothetical protein
MNDGPVQDMHSVDMRTYSGESKDLPRMGAAELAVAQEGQHVVIVVAVAAAQAGTSECTVCPGMANSHLSKNSIWSLKNAKTTMSGTH